jgi:hypothetical protein
MKYQNNNIFRMALMCFAVLFLGLICASTAHAGYVLNKTWGSGQFSKVTSIAVNSSGNVVPLQKIQKNM